MDFNPGQQRHHDRVGVAGVVGDHQVEHVAVLQRQAFRVRRDHAAFIDEHHQAIWTGQKLTRRYPARAATLRNIKATSELTMPNLNTILKDEITRLARKEIKAATDPIRRANAGHRREIAELKRQVASLQHDMKAASKPPKAGAQASDDSMASTRFSVKGLKSLRAKLGLSAAEFSQLVGASGQSIYNWEAGKAAPRASQQASLAAIRGIGKREAAKRLASLA